MSDISTSCVNIATLKDEGPLFSICTLVTRSDQYHTLVSSFEAKGFTSPKVEYLYIDNRDGNSHDGFSGLGALIHQARGRYVILCHQDVRLLEAGLDDLVRALEDLDARDQNWALAGNAGCTQDGRAVICISDRFVQNNIKGPFPQAVVSLDENFIVLKRSRTLAPSVDLKGFHLYGTDLCLQAALRGNSAYVIDFHLHHDCGVLKIDDSYYDVRQALEAKYHRAFLTRTIHTTCHAPLVTGSPVRHFWSKIKITQSRKKMHKKEMLKAKKP